MQEIKKRRIVLASVLKPVNDPRMFEKIGISLAQKYEVHIIGQPGDNDKRSTIVFHPLPSFSRLSPARLLAPLKILKEVFALRPDLLIICTHELLGVAVIAKVLLRCKTIYDVQENYYQNIVYGTAYPRYLRPLLAGFVRIKEWMLAPAIDYYFLAESTYQYELAFTKRKKVVIENKLTAIMSHTVDKKSHHDGNIHLLFSGTIAETTGVFNAIRLAVALHGIEPRIRLLITGYCPLARTLDRVRTDISDKPFIALTGGHSFIPHTRILSAIQTADFGIISYPSNPSTANAIPTKLYEYLGCRLPILLINNPSWIERCRRYPAAIPFDPEHLDASGILGQMTGESFFRTPPEDVFWDSEEQKLLSAVQAVLAP